VPFLDVSFDLGSLDAEAAEGVCFACGAVSVTLTDSRDDPVLEPGVGEIRLWPATRVNALFAADANAVPLIAAGLEIPASRIHSRIVEDRVWEREWLKDFHALRFGSRLWVCPHHEEVADQGAVVVRLDPGLAFGTGTHATTALCLEWLDREIRGGERVLDFGCGSGILGLAALKLGAASTAAFDIDPQAITATRENAAKNGLGARIEVAERCESLAGTYDIVLANILAGPLIELAPRLARFARASGEIVLAGMLLRQAAEVAQAYGPWFDIAPQAEREGWSLLAGRRRAE
jgi:ribosomal protein L11 methyltransferase